MIDPDHDPDPLTRFDRESDQRRRDRAEQLAREAEIDERLTDVLSRRETRQTADG